MLFYLLKSGVLPARWQERNMVHSTFWVTIPVRYFSDKSREDIYQVLGERLSVSEIRAVQPENRTKAHWLVLIDWDLQRQKPFVVVDPFDPSGILYLTEQQYLVQARTLGKLDAPFTIIARPGSVKPLPIKTAPLCSRLYSTDRNFQMTWKDFQRLRSQISRQIKWGPGGTVVVSDSNITPLIYQWGRNLLHYEGVRQTQIGMSYENGKFSLKEFKAFADYLSTLIRVHGVDFAIVRLKTLLFALYSSIGGNSLKETSGLNHRVRLRGGLPAFWDLRIRQSIRAGSLSRIRVWASMLNIYRYLKGTHPLPPLETIEALPFDGDLSEFHAFAQNELWQLIAVHVGTPGLNDLKFRYRSSYGLFIASAGANHSKAMASLFWDALAWTNEEVNHAAAWFAYWADGDALRLLKRTEEDAILFKLVHDWFRPMLLPKGDKLITLIKYFKVLFPQERRDEFLPILSGSESEFDEKWRLYLLSFPERVLVGQTYQRLQPGEFLTLAPVIFKILSQTWTVHKNKETFGLNYEERPQEFLRAIYARLQTGEWPSHIPVYPPVTGRLHAIPEPAGKVRVVAIVDYFSQLGLHPVHKALFNLLKHFKNDATFDQEGRVREFADRGYKELWSYDLKSATDLIPKELYREILVRYFGDEKAATLWLNLLSERNFSLKGIYGEDGDGKVRFTQYKRGQPMGAYSSWAGLALLHHALVQYAAKAAGYTTWFDHYLVLGDDIVIAEERVALAYLKVCDEFGIVVGLAKSFVSRKGLFNFAAQTFLGPDNISTLSLREEIVADSVSRRMEFAARIERRWGSLGVPTPESALRRLVSFPHWAELSSSLSGGKQIIVQNVLQFFLHNPFRKEGLNIGKVAYWLGFLSPVFRHLPLQKLMDFEEALIKASFIEFLEELGRIWELLQTLRANLKDLHPWGPPGRSACWEYVVEVITMRLDRDFGPTLDECSAFGQMHLNNKGHLRYLPSLEALNTMWARLRPLQVLVSETITKEFLRSHGVFSLLEKVEARTLDLKRSKNNKSGSPSVGWQAKFAPIKPREVLSAPLKAIALAALQVLGQVLPLRYLTDKGPTSFWIGKYLSALSEVKSQGVPQGYRTSRVPVRLLHAPIIPVESVHKQVGDLPSVRRRKHGFI